MCGIAGIMRFDGEAVDPELLSRMADRIAHRGPDGQGVWTNGSVGFAHRRLSIIDIAGSPQPMASNDGRLHVAFNGEILNYRTLRSRCSYAFRTNGDTEVLLALTHIRGPSFLDDLRGQFAFAVHDDRDGSLWLVRDRLGILPLYYWHDREQLIFASEIKALLPALPSPPTVDEDGVAAYLAHRSVPSPGTLFAGIRKLQPGHQLRTNRDGGVRVDRWWQLPPIDTSDSVPAPIAVKLVRRALEDSVDDNLVADVPVGTYLSGGVDSSLISALASQRTESGQLHTFAAGFGDPRFDELRHARRVSEHLTTVHHEVRVTADDFTQLWPQLTWHRDAPISEPADVAVFRLAEVAREHVKVVLSGEGSDELFAGYPKYRFARLGAIAGALPATARQLVANCVERRLPRDLSRGRIAVRAFGAPTEAARLEAWFAPFTTAEQAALLGSATRPPGASIPIAQGDPVRRMLYADCHAWLADNLLERGDRMSMAASLELRPPFLDHRLAELAFTLPSTVKLRHGTTKWVVKEVARALLPADIVDRPKVGFRVPLDVWFRDSLRDVAHDRLLDRSSFATTVFDRQTISKLLSDHDAGRSDEEMRIWTLVCLEVWHDQFRKELGGRPPGPMAGGHVGQGW